jgi:hypothetical protein
MFHRYTVDGREKPVDLGNLYKGSLFLCGSSPALTKDNDLSLLDRPGISVMAMNNAAASIRPDFWVSADHPDCYAEAILKDSRPLKFASEAFRKESVGHSLWQDMQTTFFYKRDNDVMPGSLLDNRSKIAWQQNVFMIAIQIAYRLGFRKVYLLGCSFKIKRTEPYCYADKSMPRSLYIYNSRTYDMAVRQFAQELPRIREAGMKIISCTKDSRLNEILKCESLEDVLSNELAGYPTMDTSSVAHSSERR